MFESIKFGALDKSSRYKHAAALEFYQNNKEVSFKPGLNIIFGPNACGKSTMLSMLADITLSSQAGFSAITESAIRAALAEDSSFDRVRTFNLEISVAHDGQPTLYFNIRHTPGLIRGHFDDDFMSMGIQNLNLDSKSGGEAGVHVLMPILATLAGKKKFPAKIQEKIKASDVNSVWGEALAVVKERLKGTIAKGQKTVLLVEPDTHMSLYNQALFWDTLERASEKFQIIVATHSPFALGRKAHYIDMVPGFKAECSGLMLQQFQRMFPKLPLTSTEKPATAPDDAANAPDLPEGFTPIPGLGSLVHVDSRTSLAVYEQDGVFKLYSGCSEMRDGRRKLSWTTLAGALRYINRMYGPLQENK